MAVLSLELVLIFFLESVLTQTYSTYNSKSNALFLSKILSTRDEMTYDPHYGAFIAQLPPLNLIVMPLVPLALVLKPHTKEAHLVNEFAMKVQYSLFMLIIFALFCISAIGLIPFGWVVGIADKIKTMDQCPAFKDKFVNKIVFIPFGFLILAVNLLVDMIYFWRVNFSPSSELKQIIIENELNDVTHQSILQIVNTF